MGDLIFLNIYTSKVELDSIMYISSYDIRVGPLL